MNKKEYLKKLDSLGFDKNEYYIIGGGTMVMYGLRDTTKDIDLKISPKLFNELKDKLIKSTKMDHLYEYGDNVELAVDNFDEMEVTYIDGYPVGSLEKEYEWKKSSGRPKDLLDIQLIEEYIKKNNK